MKLTVYRQSSKVRPDGTIVYKGEDALPYADGQIFFVADGLGGAAAIRHQKIKPELFDSEKLLETLFDGVYEDYSDERFVKYVVDSFFELFAVKDCYTDNINNIKKSGYFASRIVTAIILHEMLYNEQYSAESVFKLLDEASKNGEKDKALADIGAHFKNLIQENIRKIAANANLVYESSYSGLALLGSTVCATIYFEHDNIVEALYLTAGDSRPYVWAEDKGLCQVLADQEGADGGMTNYIKANDGADFDIRYNYFKFEKPCILFNASDGCFDSGKFISQLAFEKLILDTAVASGTVEQMGEGLTSFFVDYGRHDDSSTIAMKFFGYESFESFKESAQKRLNVLNEQYFTVMPDLLEEDYISEYEQAAAKIPSKMADLKAKFENEMGRIEYCSRIIHAGKYSPYNDAIAQIDANIESKKKNIDTAHKNIEKIIAQNFAKFMLYFDKGSEEHTGSFNAMQKIGAAENKFKENSADYITTLDKYKREFDETVKNLNILLDKIYNIGIPNGFDDYDDISFKMLESCENSMLELFNFFEKLRTRRFDVVKKLTQQRIEYIERNLKIAEKHPNAVSFIKTQIIEGKISVDELHLLSDDKKELINELSIIKESEKSIEELEIDAKAQVLRKSIKEYWENNYIEVISKLAESGYIRVNEALLVETRMILDEINEQTEGIKTKALKQKELFKKYDVVYMGLLGGIS